MYRKVQFSVWNAFKAHSIYNIRKSYRLSSLSNKALSIRSLSNSAEQNSDSCVPSVNTPSSTSMSTSTSVSADQQRPIRQEPGRVRLGIIPDEWFTFFFKKTGVSGGGAFMYTVGTFLISKEYIIMEHEFYNGLSMALLCVLASKYIGPTIANTLDKGIDKYEKSWSDVREGEERFINDSIKHEEKMQFSSEGQLMLVDAKRENVKFQLETEYRERLMKAYNETVKRLEYCLCREDAEIAIAKRQISEWVIEEVRNGITEKIQKEAIQKCLEDLKELAKTFGDKS